MLRPTEYINHEGLAQSDIKTFRKSRMAFYNQVELKNSFEAIRNNSTDIGNLVDALVTNEASLRGYEIVQGIKCSPNLRVIMDDAFNRVLNHCVELNYKEETIVSEFFSDRELVTMDRFILAAGRHAGYQSRYSDAALLNTIKSKAGGYLFNVGRNIGKKIIDKDSYDKATRCKYRLQSDEYIAPILFHPPSHIEVLQQHMLVGSYMGIAQKILLDHVCIDHQLKIVYPYDLKTAYQMAQFMVSYYDRGYGYQGSYYTDVLQQWYKGYRIAPFRFIVVSTDTEEAPLIYRMHSNEIQMYADGGYMRSGKRVIGWKETMEEIGWHRETNLWHYPKSYYMNKELVIDSIYSEKDEQDDILDLL